MKKKKVCTIYYDDENGETIYKWYDKLCGVDIPDCYGDVIAEFIERYNNSLSKEKSFLNDYKKILNK